MPPYTRHSPGQGHTAHESRVCVLPWAFLMPRREWVLQALEMGIEGDDEKRGKVL